MYNTTLDVDLLREIKILAAKLDMRQNDLIEEAILDLIEKYKHREHHAANGQVTHNRQALEHFTFIGIINTSSQGVLGGAFKNRGHMFRQPTWHL